MNTEHPANKKEKSPPKKGQETFKVNESEIDLGWKIFEPNNKEKIAGSNNHVTIFLMGWGMNHESKGIEGLCQNFANADSSPVYAISTKPKEIEEDSLYIEALAIEQFIKKNKLTDVTLIGYSEGGTKAINLASIILKKNLTIHEKNLEEEEINLTYEEAQKRIEESNDNYEEALKNQTGIDGIILLNPAGIDDRELLEFVRKFVSDSIFTTIVDLALGRDKNKIKMLGKYLTSSTDVMFGLINEIKRYGIKYPARLISQIRETTKLNPRLADVTVPVIFIRGKDDPVPSISGQNDKDIHDVLEKIFSESPFIKALEAEEHAHHLLPLMRDQDVAKTAQYLIKRFWRKSPLIERFRPQRKRDEVDEFNEVDPVDQIAA